jgi:hypothetical protein
MDLEAHFQNLASLNINPDEIENEQHAKAFNSLFAIVEILSEENIAQKEQIQMLRDECQRRFNFPHFGRFKIPHLLI